MCFVLQMWNLSKKCAAYAGQTIYMPAYARRQICGINYNQNAKITLTDFGIEGYAENY